jgi:hypothetical protein
LQTFKEFEKEKKYLNFRKWSRFPSKLAFLFENLTNGSSERGDYYSRSRQYYVENKSRVFADIKNVIVNRN